MKKMKPGILHVILGMVSLSVITVPLGMARLGFNNDWFLGVFLSGPIALVAALLAAASIDGKKEGARLARLGLIMDASVLIVVFMFVVAGSH